MPPRADTTKQGPEPDGLMLFDGHCHMCSATVQAVLAADRKGEIRFAPMQSELGRKLMGEQGLDPDDPTSFVFFDHGAALTKSDAMLAMAMRFPWPWRGAGAFRLLPRSLRDVLYDLIARNRYRLFGRREVCFVPTTDQRERFLG